LIRLFRHLRYLPFAAFHHYRCRLPLMPAAIDAHALIDYFISFAYYFRFFRASIFRLPPFSLPSFFFSARRHYFHRYAALFIFFFF